MGKRCQQAFLKQIKAHKYMQKKLIITLFIRKMQLKYTITYYHMPVRNDKCCKMSKRGKTYTAMCKLMKPLSKAMHRFSINLTLLCDPATPQIVCIYKGNKITVEGTSKKKKTNKVTLRP